MCVYRAGKNCSQIEVTEFGPKFCCSASAHSHVIQGHLMLDMLHSLKIRQDKLKDDQ